MSTESKNRILHSGVASIVAGLGMLPGAAKAQAVVDVEAALDTPNEPVQDFDQQALESGVTVKSRDVAWDVPWIEPTPPAVKEEPWVPVAEPQQLASAFAEEAAIAQAAQSDFPLIAIAEPAVPEPPAATPEPAVSESVSSESADLAATPLPEIVLSDASISEISISEASTSAAIASDADPLEVAIAETPVTEEAASEESFSEAAVKEAAVPAVPETLYLPDTPLVALTEADEDEDEEDVFEAVVPQLALATDTEEEEEEESDLLAIANEEKPAETVSPYLAIALTNEEVRQSQRKVPWLASSLDVIGPDPADTEDLLSLNLSAIEEEEEEETEDERLSLNITSQEDEFDAEGLLSIDISATAAEDEKVSPWLAIANEEEEETEDERLSLNLTTQDEERPDPRLSISLTEQNAPKRSANWTSAVLEELVAPDSSAGRPTVTLIAAATRDSGPVYDVTNLRQVAITPVSLAEANESAVDVSASQVEFLSPQANAFLEIPATSVVLRFPVGANIALLANGEVVDSSLVGRTETDSNTGLRIQSWYGIVLQTGENLLEVISTQTGEVLQNLPLTVKGLPERLVLLNPRSIPSDGRSTSAIRGQFIDESGNIAVWESMATLRASDGQFLGADQDPDAAGYQVEVRGGEFVAELQSSLESHLVQIQANAGGFEAFSQIQFVTPQRPHLLSGSVDIRLGARGTDYYDSYRAFLPTDDDNQYEFDVDAAVFATGNIGEWLYTGAYNSDRNLNDNCQGETTLFRSGSGSCGNSYATYGDDSYSDVVAPSLDSVYLRLERNSPSSTGIDYAMWGDFDTQEFATSAQLFTATSRQLHGFKANYNYGGLTATGLYSNNVEGFQRDTIAPDGTSGFYFTSQRNIVPGSESVYLELEELERPGTVLERQQLARGADYDVDYDRGSFLFEEPVTRTSVNEFGDLLVRRIVTTYQYENGADTDILAGRLQYSLNRQQGRESWIGASYFNEDQGNRDFTLYGADALVTLGDNARVIAEVAQSVHNFDASDSANGGAYRVEVEGNAGGLAGRAFFRTTDAGFANSATSSFVPGQTRYGGQLTGGLGRTTSVRARYDREDNFGTAPQVLTDLSSLLSGINSSGTPVNNSLTTYALGLTQQIGRSTAEVDWIHRDRTDRLTNDDTLSTDQLRSRLSVPLSRRLSIVAQNEINLSSDVDPIYPGRTLVGLNWQAMPGLNVGLNQIFYSGGGDNSRGNVTSLDVTGEHTFKSDTTVRGRFSTVDGRQLGGSIGLEQGIQLAPGLDLDLGYERVFSTFGNETAASTQFRQPVATGSGASALGLSGGESYSIGLSYTDNADFQASSRFEHRRSSRGSNTVFDLSALGRVTPALTVLGDYRLAHAANQGLSRGIGTTSLLKLGLAYRDPENDRFNALLRYEHRRNPNSVPNSATLAASTETQEHLLAAEAIYAPNWRWELYGKYALRNSRTDIDAAGNNFSDSSTVQLAQARATYRLGYQWDVVGEARWLGGNGFNETGFSAEAGYYPLPDLRVSAGYSGGATDYDFGNNRSAGGFYVGVTAKLSGLLNGFGTRPDAPRQQQESVVQVSNEGPAVTTGSGEDGNAQDYPTATEL